ncbi:MAG: right-handed parallel beta-helix repeat-containing protein [Thermodesulfobacteria bacterium]|nr:right-handed parallel beta-helix repeat-containing protein [Thermodesulfobacteriota bacterium]
MMLSGCSQVRHLYWSAVVNEGPTKNLPEDHVTLELPSLEKADIILEDNEVHDNVKSGIRVRGSSRVLISRCKVFRNGRSGLRLERKCNVTVDNSDIFLNASAGIDVMNGSRGTFLRSNIYQNQATGVRIKTKGVRAPEYGLFRLYKTRIFLNGQAGVLAVPRQDTGIGLELLFSDVFHNARAGVRVRGDVYFRGKRNDVYLNQETGLAFFSQGDVLPRLDVYENKIFLNGRAGVQVLGGVTGPIGLTNNWIYNNNDSGIAIGLGSETGSRCSVLRIYHNTIVGNGSGSRGAGIINRGKGWLDIENNIIAFNVRAGLLGIHCEDASHNLLFDNGQTTTFDADKPYAFLIKRSQYGGCLTSGSGDILTDPLFKAPATFDYSLTDSSPAKGAASLLPGAYFQQFPSKDMGSLVVPPGNIAGGAK